MIYKIKKICLGIILILLPIDISLGNIIGGMSLVNYVMIIYILMGIVDLLIGNKKKNIFKNKTINITIWFLIIIIGSILMGEKNIITTLQETAIYTLTLSILFFIITMLDTYDENYKKYIKKCILLGCISVMLGYVYTEFKGYTFQGRFTMAIGRAADPNYFATNLGIIITLLFYENLEKKSKIKIIMLLMLVMILFMTGSRTALLGISVSIITIIMLKYKKNLIKLILISIIGIILVYMIVNILKDSIPQDIFDRFKISSISEDKGSLRLDYWKSAIEYYKLNCGIIRFFIGWGFSAFGIVTSTALGFNAAPHNMYIQVWFEIGVFGIITFFMILIINLRNAILKKNIFMISILIGLYITGMTLDMVLTRYFWIIIFLNNIDFMDEKGERNENYNVC